MSSKIEVIGLGAGDVEQLPLGIYRRLTTAQQAIFVRTKDHPVIQELEAEGVTFHSFDSIYEQFDQFEDVYEKIVATLLDAARSFPIVYAVPGHPMLAEKTVQLLLKESSAEVEIVGGQSYLDDLFTVLQIDPIEGLQFIDATSFQREEISYRQHIVFTQVYDAFIASEIKLTLLEDLPESYELTILEAVGTKRQTCKNLPLVELDRVVNISNLTSVYVPPVPDHLLEHQFTTLRNVIRVLRGPNGCEWDKKQTHESLQRYALEEVYELIDAIDQGNIDGMIEELGDVLLQVVLHSQIGEDAGYFTMDDVVDKITKKMVHRHPHIFGGGKQTKSWEELKNEEKPERDPFLLDEIIVQAPALQVAYEVQKNVGRIGFDWENIAQIWQKFDEEYQEFTEAVRKNDKLEMEIEFGDLLFVLANIARHFGIQPELALYKANKKFIGRFMEVERQMRYSGDTFVDMDVTILNMLWENAKEKE